MGEQLPEFCSCCHCGGFVAVWLFSSSVTNPLPFVLPFHNLLCLCNCPLCVCSLPCFLPPVPPCSPESCCVVFVPVGVFVTLGAFPQPRLPLSSPSLPGVGPRTATPGGVCVGLPGKVSVLKTAFVSSSSGLGCACCSAAGAAARLLQCCCFPWLKQDLLVATLQRELAALLPDFSSTQAVAF